MSRAIARGLAVALAAWGLSWGAPASGQGADASGGEVLTRGPIHESFAQPVVYDPKPGPVISKAPPEPIREAPPDQKPEGANVVWIPGYWAWDDGRDDYLWVSGAWRKVPPGRQWVPGYWHEVAGGVQWAPGAWMMEQSATASYYPTPPPSVEAGPNAPSPVADAVWAPGCWIWQGGVGYVWRPGFWVAPQPNWVWVPAQYVWTPAGYLFAEGYWDRPFDLRGQMFAPVYFSQPVYAAPTYVYRPTIGLVASGLIGSLFVRPSFGVYYFGDYYAPSYFGVGIYPSYAYHASRFGYDPIFSYYSVTYRTSNPGWGASVREEYFYRRDHAEARPPRTFVEMNRVSQTNITVNNTTIVNNNVRNVSFARPIREIAADHAAAGSPIRFERLAAAEQRQHAADARRFQDSRHERVRAEQNMPVGPHPGPRTVEMPRSPVAAHQVAAHHPTPAPAATEAHGGPLGLDSRGAAAFHHAPPPHPSPPGVAAHGWAHPGSGPAPAPHPMAAYNPHLAPSPFQHAPMHPQPGGMPHPVSPHPSAASPTRPHPHEAARGAHHPH